MKVTTLLLSGLLTSTIVLANPYESEQEELASVIETGQKSSMLLLKTLGGNLKKHMKAGGPIAAAEFCMTNAFTLTDKVGNDLGEDVTVKRISLKERNPANRPATDEESTVLNTFQALQDNNILLPKYLVEQVNKDTYKYYKPLSINKGVCLKCHGDISKDKEVEAYIGENYPADKATGYKLNDLRGAIVVTIKK